MGKKVISLFSGAGGMDIGFSSAGFEIAVACEADHSCCQTLMRNNPSLKVIEGDIRDVPTSEILQVAGLAPMEAALVIGGPPCFPAGTLILSKDGLTYCYHAGTPFLG